LNEPAVKPCETCRTRGSATPIALCKVERGLSRRLRASEATRNAAPSSVRAMPHCA
jgi:hypothetical protein